ncbi:MAG TPA: 3-dehydroquinate synthase [Flavobacterium sp.]|jgi:3-dehydroquinate synthase|uniref:3-dehydroquinate synthase n=1 Tax=Flavobacterium sp. TaxID=239 RepID=UPI002BAC0922|nr:3-dehydroquinate synthase [Flavobacterium sp.]MCA0350332.1 3-dehydroquinate synthase [Bacteroidota bacterium]HPW99013.1 3-dehydroquinate synthase [Flavobacterium sp.]HQA74812.1 3-dehydroquinate synthase [Flavobacterium sp.]
MQSINANEYSIHFSQNAYQFLSEIIENENYSNLFILVDSNTNEFCLPHFLPNLATTKTIEIIEIEAGEEQKNINTCVEIWKILTELGGDRKSLLINLGGGVVTDIGGFVASTFKRGIDFINIPTSLLAMVDASIGGKNGVDLGTLKNQIGVINVPKMVIIDTEYLADLPQNQMRSGLAEMLKHGLIYDKTYWEKFLDLSQSDGSDIDTLIHRSVAIKNEIVSQDLTENGIRKSLNFGHTLGHAIESYFLENDAKNTLLHGEAIAVGMIMESYISFEKKLISKTELELIKSILLHYFEKVIFIENDIEPIVNLLIHDKKNEYGKVQFCLLDGIGKTIYNQEADNELINRAFNYYNS